MKSRIYTILEIMFVALFIFSGYKLFTIYTDYSEGDQIYEESADTYFEVEEETREDGVNENTFTVDIDALKEENPEALTGLFYGYDYPVSAV